MSISSIQDRFADMYSVNVRASALRGLHAAPGFLLYKHINVHDVLVKAIGPSHLQLVSQFAVEFQHSVTVKQMRHMGGRVVDALLPVLTTHCVIAVEFVLQASHQCGSGMFSEPIADGTVNWIAVFVLNECSIGLEVRKGDRATQQDAAVEVKKQAGNAGDAMQHGLDCARIVCGKILGGVEE
jgi:hypothetical protein